MPGAWEGGPWDATEFDTVVEEGMEDTLPSDKFLNLNHKERNTDYQQILIVNLIWNHDSKIF